MNVLSTTAAALTTALDGEDVDFGQAFTVERCYVPPDYDSAADRALKLFVIGFEESIDLHGENSTRHETEHGYGLKVAIVKRVTAADVTKPAALAELDGLSDVREGVIDFLKANRVMGDCELVTATSPAAYDPTTLTAKKVFVSVIDAKYRTLR